VSTWSSFWMVWMTKRVGFGLWQLLRGLESAGTVRGWVAEGGASPSKWPGTWPVSLFVVSNGVQCRFQSRVENTQDRRERDQGKHNTHEHHQKI